MGVQLDLNCSFSCDVCGEKGENIYLCEQSKLGLTEIVICVKCFNTQMKEKKKDWRLRVESV